MTVTRVEVREFIHAHLDRYLRFDPDLNSWVVVVPVRDVADELATAYRLTAAHDA